MCSMFYILFYYCAIVHNLKGKTSYNQSHNAQSSLRGSLTDTSLVVHDAQQRWQRRACCPSVIISSFPLRRPPCVVSCDMTFGSWIAIAVGIHLLCSKPTIEWSSTTPLQMWLLLSMCTAFWPDNHSIMINYLIKIHDFLFIRVSQLHVD